MYHLISFGFGAAFMYVLAGVLGWYRTTTVDPCTDADFVAVKHRWFVYSKGWSTKEIDADSYDEAKMKADAWRGASTDPEHCAVKLVAFRQE